MIPSLPPPEPQSAADAARHALVEYIGAACHAEEVEVHALSVDLSRWNNSFDANSASPTATSFRWSGDACSARPDLALTVLENDVASSRMSVRPHVTVWIKAPVAAFDLKPQQEIAVEWRKVPIEKLARQPIATTGIARAAIRAGEPLTRLVVTVAPDLRDGTAVDILVRRGELTVHAEGKSLADAMIGEKVAVLNSATKTALQGTVVDSHTVEIR